MTDLEFDYYKTGLTPQEIADKYKLKKENPYPHKDPTCECCGTKSNKEVLNLDHCHKYNTFRGWLCRSCNIGIGALGDNIEGLEKAVAYIRSKDEQH